MKILIVEDDAVSRKVLHHQLLKLGHDVFQAAQGEQAWTMLLETQVQIVVSDWMMPTLDGVALCQRVRQRRTRHYIYFILLTALTDRDHYLEAMNAGIDDFLSKPLRIDELAIRLRVAERILQYLDQVQNLRQLIPICSYCKRVRDDTDYWHRIESFVTAHTGADLSHSICPECYEKVVKPQLDEVARQAAPQDGGEAAS